MHRSGSPTSNIITRLHPRDSTETKKKLIELNKGRAKVTDEKNYYYYYRYYSATRDKQRAKKVTMKKTNKHILDLNEFKRSQNENESEKETERVKNL